MMICVAWECRHVVVNHVITFVVEAITLACLPLPLEHHRLLRARLPPPVAVPEMMTPHLLLVMQARYGVCPGLSGIHCAEHPVSTRLPGSS